VRVLFDGLGNAGQAIVRALRALWSCGQAVAHPEIWLADNAVWRPHHARAGLASEEYVGLPKVETTRRKLIGRGWPADRVRADRLDIRDCPRTRYEASLTLALTDSHETKALSVERALSVGSPAIAVGLGETEAVVECFSPSGAGYCCIHSYEDGYSQRHPCMPDSRQVSTTETTSRSAAHAAGRLVANLIAGWISTGSLAGDRGWTVTARGAEEFGFSRDPHCPGLHDAPVDPTDAVYLSVTPAQIRADDLLGRLGASATYADRPVAWNWRCRTCGEQQLLHNVHPAARCPVCAASMEAGFERVTGLDACELRVLGSPGRVPTLAAMGLAEERLLRCVVDDRVIWVRLRGTE
jgi:hypothetical protein